MTDDLPNRHSAAIWLFALVSLAACTAVGTEGDGSNHEQGSGVASAGAAGRTEPENGLAGDDPALHGPAGTIGLFGPPKVHPERVLAGVTGITLDEHSNLLVDLEVWNRSQRRIRVAVQGAMRLEDDLGNTYEPVTPDGGFNNLELRTDQRAEITLGFLGPVDPDATRITLGLNARDGFYAPAAEDGHLPRFTFADLPLPGVGLDDEGAGDGQGGLDLRPVSIDIDGHGVELDDIGLVGEIDLRRVTVGPLSLELDIYLRNDGNQVAALRRQIQIVPERDGDPMPEYGFEFVRSVADEEIWQAIEVQPGEEMEATLMFRAAMPHDAETFRIGFNQVRNEWLVRGDELSPEARHPNTSLYGIPLPDRTDRED